MSHNRLEFDGLEDLTRALRALPAELTAEAATEVERAANAAAAEVKRNYARVSGDLVAGVDVVHEPAGRFAAGATVRSRSKHAWMYENGTQVRHTSRGANRGVMPAAGPGRAFIPVMPRHRRTMYERLKAMLERTGLRVTGDAR